MIGRYCAGMLIIIADVVVGNIVLSLIGGSIFAISLLTALGAAGVFGVYELQRRDKQ